MIIRNYVNFTLCPVLHSYPIRFWHLLHIQNVPANAMESLKYFKIIGAIKWPVVFWHSDFHKITLERLLCLNSKKKLPFGSKTTLTDDSVRGVDGRKNCSRAAGRKSSDGSRLSST